MKQKNNGNNNNKINKMKEHKNVATVDSEGWLSALVHNSTTSARLTLPTISELSAK